MDWLEKARQAAARPPARARDSLFARVGDGGEPAEIGSVEPALAERLLAAGLPLHRSNEVWVVASPIDASLERIARWLHGEGICPHWRGEVLAVTDTSGREVGVIERGAVRALGIKTFAVHLIGFAPGDAVWAQQRSATKATDPGQWDTLMGGQIAAGESIATALERETMEEAGLVIGELHDLRRRDDMTIRRPLPEGYMVEEIAVFCALVPEGVEPVNRDGEVDRFECLEEEALVERLHLGAFTLEAALILGAELERRGRGPR
jgi:8-oxo-dGTP pyrophosphatase MutT (NUDIX family)